MAVTGPTASAAAGAADRATVTVEVDDRPSGGVPPNDDPPDLAHTGLSLLTVLAIAAALIAAGVLARALARRFDRTKSEEPDMEPTRTTRRARALLATTLAVLLTALGGGAAAATTTDTDDTTVTNEVTGAEALNPSLELDLLNLSGDPLDDLALHNGGRRAFQTQVAEAEWDPDATYTVDASLSNLYRLDGDGGYADAAPIESADVTLGFLSSSVDMFGVEVGVNPSGTLINDQIITCGALAALCDILDDLGLGDLGGLLGSSDGVEVDNLALNPEDVIPVPLADLPPGAADVLPVAASPGGGGNFSNSDCGAAPAAVPAAALACNTGDPVSTQTTLRTDPLSGDLTGLLSEIEGALPAETDFTAEILDALEQDGVLIGEDDGLLDDLITAVRDLTAAEQDTFVDEYFQIDWALTADDIVGIDRTRRTQPTLTINDPDAEAGTYRGVMTVTIVSDS